MSTMRIPKRPCRETFITPYGDSLSKNQKRYGMKIRGAGLPTMDAVRLLNLHEMISHSGDIHDFILREGGHHITPLSHQMINQLNLHPFSTSA